MPQTHFLPGAREILAAHGPCLPQPDQLCGPFSAALALRALVERPPAVVELALASGTRVWPHDVQQWRPSGARLDRTGWDLLPAASDPSLSGTDAAGLAAGITALCPDVVVVPASGAEWRELGALLVAIAEAELPVAVLANLLTDLGGGPVGHFVIVWALAEADPEADPDAEPRAFPERILVADTYTELGDPGLPPGCRFVATADLTDRLGDRGLLLLTLPDQLERVSELVLAAGLTTRLWST